MKKAAKCDDTDLAEAIAVITGDCPKRTFGEEEFALRAGFRWSQDHGCYIRIRGEFFIEVADPGHVPHFMYRSVLEWWDNPAILGMVDELERIRCRSAKVGGYREFMVNNDGSTVEDLE